MTTEHEASRTLVKSPPELWAECSDAGSLARHLGEFGEITITRLEPESTVAWEGEHASGTVRIEPSGWGTRVTLTAHTKAELTEDPPLPPDDGPAGDLGADVEPLPPDPEIPTAQEESDAATEETLEDPDLEPEAVPGRARARWRRLTGRMRGLFGSGEQEGQVIDVAPGDEPSGIEEPEPELEPQPEQEPESAVALGPEPAPQTVADSVPEPETAPAEPEFDAETILASALDSLGQAHHRPFSRA